MSAIPFLAALPPALVEWVVFGLAMLIGALIVTLFCAIDERLQPTMTDQERLEEWEANQW